MSLIFNECGWFRSILLHRNLCTNTTLAIKHNFSKALLVFILPWLKWKELKAPYLVFIRKIYYCYSDKNISMSLNEIPMNVYKHGIQAMFPSYCCYLLNMKNITEKFINNISHSIQYSVSLGWQPQFISIRDHVKFSKIPKWTILYVPHVKQ